MEKKIDFRTLMTLVDLVATAKDNYQDTSVDINNCPYNTGYPDNTGLNICIVIVALQLSMVL